MRITAFVKAAITLAVWGGLCGAAIAEVTCGVVASQTFQLSYSAASLFGTSTDQILSVECRTLLPNDPLVPVAVQIGLSSGMNSQSFATRAMSGPGPTLLEYNVYKPSAPSVPWGDLASGASVSTSVGPFSSINTPARTDIPIRFTIRAGQWGVSQGIYSDTLQITLSF